MELNVEPLGNKAVRNPFKSFLMGGFECADHMNAFGIRADMIRLTGHEQFLAHDYDALKSIGVKTVREGICWSRVERVPFEYDWEWVDKLIDASVTTRVQVVWDICHFGYADDLTPLHPMFARRFAHLCAAFVQHYRARVPDGELVITPINEVSFISWLGGEVRGTQPYCTNHGWEVKYALMKAYIEGIERMKEIDPGVRILTTEPLVNIVAGGDADVELAFKKNEDQFQVLEILSGRVCPELRGRPEYLDILGLNFYFNNQWYVDTHVSLPWKDEPPHNLWKPLDALLLSVYSRYKRPLVLAETSHPGDDRAIWLQMALGCCRKLLMERIPLLGCCIYPLIDRPDWDDFGNWHKSGVWDVNNYVTLERTIHEESARVLRDFNKSLNII